MHPGVRIIVFFAFVAALPLMHASLLLTTGFLLSGILGWKGGRVFLLFVRRARWLLLSILLVYAYATPGEYVAVFPEALAPTYEGLRSGLLQAGRLVCVLAALSFLQATTPRQEMMAGLCFLLRPLRLLGFAPERFAVRLWLTLHYVETMPAGVLRQLRQQRWRLDALPVWKEGPDTMFLASPRLCWQDIAVLMLIPPVFWMLA